jgi:flagellar biosynthetic protein FlhB
MFEDRDEARHPASEQRQREARLAGRIPLSRDLAGTLVWLGAAGMVAAFGAGIWQSLESAAVPDWSEPPPLDADSGYIIARLSTAGSFLLGRVAPLLAGIAGIAVLAFAVQTRFGLFPRGMGNGFRQMGLAAWARRAGWQRAGLDAMAGLTKLVLLCAVAWWVLAGDIPGLLELGGPALERGLGSAGVFLAGILVKLCGAACLVGLADYGLRWRAHQRQLQMTDEELREEQRATEAPAAVRRRRQARPLSREDSPQLPQAGRTMASAGAGRAADSDSVS